MKKTSHAMCPVACDESTPDKQKHVLYWILFCEKSWNCEKICLSFCDTSKKKKKCHTSFLHIVQHSIGGVTTITPLLKKQISTEIGKNYNRTKPDV